LFRRDAVLAVGNYDPKLLVNCDYDMVDRLCDVGLMLALPEPLTEYRLHGNNNSRQNFTFQSKEASYLWSRRAARDRGEPFPSYDEFMASPPNGPRLQRWLHASRERSRFHWDSTGVHLACGRRWRAVQSAVQSVLWNPSSVVHRIWRKVIRPRIHQRAHVSARHST
jgi:hypothetical protein